MDWISSPRWALDHHHQPNRPSIHRSIDFYEGTLDVSLLYVHRGFVTVEGVDGDDHLGGTRALLHSPVLDSRRRRRRVCVCVCRGGEGFMT